MVLGFISTAMAVTPEPTTFARFVPERSDDFARENDKVAFRAYGPALHDSKEKSGVVSAPIVGGCLKRERKINRKISRTVISGHFKHFGVNLLVKNEHFGRN